MMKFIGLTMVAMLTALAVWNLDQHVRLQLIECHLGLSDHPTECDNAPKEKG